jgi:hypothetical protein
VDGALLQDAEAPLLPPNRTAKTAARPRSTILKW